MTELHVVVPASVADAGRPSGGNVYDRRVCEELAGLGAVVDPLGNHRIQARGRAHGVRS